MPSINAGEEPRSPSRWGDAAAGFDGNPNGARNGESAYHPYIYLCGPPRKPWAELWKEHRDFG